MECDAIMCLDDGRYGLIEIKTGGDALIEKGVKAIDDLCRKLDMTKLRKPSFKMVLTADGEFVYRHEKDVLICPIGCLRI